MENIRVYHLWWEKKRYEDYEELNGENHRGLYQIYADHPVYGRNCLIYIGQTQEQTFAQRLNKHNDFIDTHFKNFGLYIGMLIERDDIVKTKYKEIIDEIEMLLINAHCPAYNSNEIKNIVNNNEYSNTIVLNWNDYGSLLPEVSGLRFSSKYWDRWDKEAKLMKY